MSAKNQIDFTDLSEQDAVSIVVNTGVVAKNSGHGVVVRHARVGGQMGILIFAPNYEMRDGQILPLVANEEGATS